MCNFARIYVFVLLLIAVVSTKVVCAAEQTVTANVAFDLPLTLSYFASAAVGTVRAGVADVYTVIPNSGTYAQNDQNNILYGAAGSFIDMFVSGSATQTIAFSVGNYSGNNGVTPSAATCSYDDAPAVSCNSLSAQSPPSLGKSLFIGYTLTVDGSQSAGDSVDTTFDVTVAYE